MANSLQARKRIRQTERRTTVNRDRRTRMRTFVRKVEEAIEAGDADAAKAALHDAEPQLMRGAQRGVIDKNTASRKVSRLSARVKALAS